jgi:phage terminase Nu1 subunit (DNA packaging protein)
MADLRPVPPELVTRQELAEMMRISVPTVDRLRKAGMPCVRFSPGTVRFRPAEAMAWAENRYSKAA